MPANYNRGSKSSKQPRTDSSKPGVSDASPMRAERLKRLYSSMLHCRIADEAPRETGARGVSSRGLEAIIAGASVHLKSTDLIAPSPYRDWIRLVQEALRKFAAERTQKSEMADEAHGSKPTAGQFHLAAGMAFACKLMKKDSAVLYLAMADENEHFWQDALEFCAKHHLPVVFVLAHAIEKENERAGDLRKDAQNPVPTIIVDGNDAVAVSRVAEESIRRAREGLGSSVIQCLFEPKRDPLLFMEGYLKQRTLWSETWKQGLVRRFTQQSKAAKLR